jgi:chemotaxis protein MotB
MSLVRTLAIIPLAVLTISAIGCKPRGTSSIAEQERNAEGSRATSALQAENRELAKQLAQAREELDKNKGGTIGDQATALGVTGIEGMTSSNGRVSLGEDFAFEKGKASLNKEGKKAIEQLALKLNDGDLANHLVVVEGHTDDKPVSRPDTIDRYGDNWGLSAARSASVVRALQHAGVKAERLRGAFRGPYAPVAGAKDGAANRRVEIFLSK